MMNGKEWMNGKECRATRREIDESELNQQLSNQARAHVALCESCRNFRAERTSLRELVGSLEPVAAPGDFDLRLRARLAREPRGHAQPFIFRFVIRAPAITVAALVVVMALSLVWLARRNTSQAPEIARVPVKEVPSGPQQPVPTMNQSDTGQAPVLTAHRTDGAKLGTVNAPRGNNEKIASADVKAVDYSVSHAESIKEMESRAGEVSLSAPLKPMVVSMQDDRGATRRISLPPVSFGAQRMVDNRTPVSFSSNSRSW
jgi:hypothetical protein